MRVFQAVVVVGNTVNSLIFVAGIFYFGIQVCKFYQ